MYYLHNRKKYLITKIKGNFKPLSSDVEVKNIKAVVSCSAEHVKQRIEKEISSYPFTISTGFTEEADSTSIVRAIGSSVRGDAYKDVKNKGYVVVTLPISISSPLESFFN